MPRIDVSPDDLLALSRRLSAYADDLDRQRLGARGAMDALAQQLGGAVSGSALLLGDAADEAVAGFVGDCRTMAELLSVSAGVYLTADDGVPARQPNPALL